MIRAMHPTLILTRNNLSLTKKCIKSVLGQRLSKVSCFVVDNGSNDGSVEFLRESGVLMTAFPDNHGVSAGWNHGLDFLFTAMQADHVLVLNNDAIIPEWFYAALLSYDEGFVTGVAVDDMEQTKAIPARMPLTPNPDFSAFLIRKEFWKKVGKFDEHMRLYASDCDMHVRGHRAGLGMWKANAPYYHERSSTMNKATPEDRDSIQEQAHRDREVFRTKYGTIPGEPDYEKLFQ